MLQSVYVLPLKYKNDTNIPTIFIATAVTTIPAILANNVAIEHTKAVHWPCQGHMLKDYPPLDGMVWA